MKQSSQKSKSSVLTTTILTTPTPTSNCYPYYCAHQSNHKKKGVVTPTGGHQGFTPSQLLKVTSPLLKKMNAPERISNDMMVSIPDEISYQQPLAANFGAAKSRPNRQTLNEDCLSDKTREQSMNSKSPVQLMDFKSGINLLDRFIVTTHRQQLPSQGSKRVKHNQPFTSSQQQKPMMVRFAESPRGKHTDRSHISVEKQLNIHDFKQDSFQLICEKKRKASEERMRVLAKQNNFSKSPIRKQLQQQLKRLNQNESETRRYSSKTQPLNQTIAKQEETQKKKRLSRKKSPQPQGSKSLISAQQLINNFGGQKLNAFSTHHRIVSFGGLNNLNEGSTPTDLNHQPSIHLFDESHQRDHTSLSSSSTEADFQMNSVFKGKQSPSKVVFSIRGTATFEQKPVKRKSSNKKKTKINVQ